MCLVCRCYVHGRRCSGMNSPPSTSGKWRFHTDPLMLMLTVGSLAASRHELTSMRSKPLVDHVICHDFSTMVQFWGYDHILWFLIVSHQTCWRAARKNNLKRLPTSPALFPSGSCELTIELAILKQNLLSPIWKIKSLPAFFTALKVQHVTWTWSISTSMNISSGIHVNHCICMMLNYVGWFVYLLRMCLIIKLEDWRRNSTSKPQVNR